MSSAAAVTDASFEQDVLQSDVPVLVDFWAPWCGPCRMVAPVLEQLAAKYAGRIKVVKVNVDDNPRTAQTYDARSIPTLVFAQDGKTVERIIGAQPAPALSTRIDALLAK